MDSRRLHRSHERAHEPAIDGLRVERQASPIEKRARIVGRCGHNGPSDLATAEGSQRGEAGGLSLVPPHCDPTVNLHDVYHVVEGGALVAIWPVDARGKR